MSFLRECAQRHYHAELKEGNCSNDTSDEIFMVYQNYNASLQTVGLGSSEPIILAWKTKNIAAAEISSTTAMTRYVFVEDEWP